MIKMTLDNGVIDRTCAVYAENEIEPSWSIRPSAAYDENQIGQLCNWQYRCGLHRKRSWIVMID